MEFNIRQNDRTEVKTMDECKHSLNAATCAICRGTSRETETPRGETEAHPQIPRQSYLDFLLARAEKDGSTVQMLICLPSVREALPLPPPLDPLWVKSEERSEPASMPKRTIRRVERQLPKTDASSALVKTPPKPQPPKVKMSESLLVFILIEEAQATAVACIEPAIENAATVPTKSQMPKALLVFILTEEAQVRATARIEAKRHGNFSKTLRRDQSVARGIDLYALSEAERNMVEMRFGLADGIPHKLEEVGKKVGLTRERVRQVMRKVLSPEARWPSKFKPKEEEKVPPMRTEAKPPKASTPVAPQRSAWAPLSRLWRWAREEPLQNGMVLVNRGGRRRIARKRRK